MNKKYLVYSALIMLLLACKPSFAMYGAIFKAARAVGVITLPVFGMHAAYKGNDEIQKEAGLMVSTAIEQWGKEKLKKLKVPSAESIVFEYHLFEWASCGKKIKVPIDEVCILNQALKSKESWLGRIGFLRGDEDKIIASRSMILKHEIGHIVNNDTQNRMYAMAALPIGIEALSFGATKAFREVCNIQMPKTFIKTALRSSAALGAIGPKVLVNTGLWISLCRHQERQADKFACEHAESRLELEQFAKWHKKYENSDYANKNRTEIRLLEAFEHPIHPAPIDRRERVENYIGKWDAEHATGGKRT